MDSERDQNHNLVIVTSEINSEEIMPRKSRKRTRTSEAERHLDDLAREAIEEPKTVDTIVTGLTWV